MAFAGVPLIAKKLRWMGHGASLLQQFENQGDAEAL
jgi:hypothetical protein